ncbi:hypothetical protein MKW92_018492 [Papaver armeniacum]|nr:hypothetical protein MKW92_018492 [Papaver armeniacum]
MANFFISSSASVIFLVLASITLPCFALHDDRKVYIVYMGSLPSETEYEPTSHHHSLLQEMLEGSSLATDVIAHSYKRSFNGFAAKLTEQEAQKLSEMEGIVSVFPSERHRLQTTRSWNFVGFSETAKRVHTVESDIIVGVIDSGIWPESASFSDEGFGPPPKKWKGVCAGGQNFTCNNKLIGARVYATEVGDSSPSARDIIGHGTHTASIAAGNAIKDASFYDVARGTARGEVPSARIAVYKVCSSGDEDCYSHDILAGFDDAIADGVDILSLSMGDRPTVFYKDPYAIGSYHAIEKDVLTSQGAGNDGPSQQTVLSTAPWLLTVGASITDRHLVTKVVLGNGKTLVGNGVNAFNLSGTKFPLVYGDNVSNGECVNALVRRCGQLCLDRKFVKGKILICDDVYGLAEALNSGAIGTVLIDNDDSVVYPMSATQLSGKAGEYVKSYFNSTRNPVATILKTESIRNDRAPMVASFSSRGPNSIIPDIIKPDIMAPGVDILAAFSPVPNPSDFTNAAWSVNYNILSGTSMSCPHATGAAAYVKSFHPDWPASFIKSALMTTAFDMIHTGDPGREFSYGSGQIDPLKAINPGLVYHTSTEDYISMLCNVGLDAKKIRLITNRSCPSKIRPGNARNLNYPSLGAHIVAHKPFKLTFRRTVTNFGNAHSTYHATIRADSDRINVTVNPNVLSFNSLTQRKSFVVTVVGDALDYSETATGSLIWSDGNHTVRSPLVVCTHDFEHHHNEQAVKHH